MRLTVALAALVACAIPSLSVAHPFGAGSYGKLYTNSAGHIVRRPVLANEKPAGATGRCADGYWTFSEGRDGACQGHGGLSVWLH